MKFAFKHQPSYTLLDVTLAPGDSLKTEAGAMVFMDPGLRVETSFGSGILSAAAASFSEGNRSLSTPILQRIAKPGWVSRALWSVTSPTHTQQ